MQLSSRGVRRGAPIAVALGVALIIVALIVMWLGSDEDDKPLTQDRPANSEGLRQSDKGLVDTGKLLGPRKAAQGTVDPFATSSGRTIVHKVEIRFASDGPFYAGWRYRAKGSEGSKAADRTLVIRRTVKSARPVALAGVQVRSPATYATCTVVVDGVAVSEKTARGADHVAVCLG